jgi:hypothetical protein
MAVQQKQRVDAVGCRTCVSERIGIYVFDTSILQFLAGAGSYVGGELFPPTPPSLPAGLEGKRMI